MGQVDGYLTIRHRRVVQRTRLMERLRLIIPVSSGLLIIDRMQLKQKCSDDDQRRYSLLAIASSSHRQRVLQIIPKSDLTCSLYFAEGCGPDFILQTCESPKLQTDCLSVEIKTCSKTFAVCTSGNVNHKYFRIRLTKSFSYGRTQATERRSF